MKRFSMSRPTPAVALSGLALFAALGGTSYAAGASNQASSSAPDSHMPTRSQHGPGWASPLGGLSAQAYMLSKHFVSSGGVHFLSMGQKSVVVGKAGHFTFLASCQRVTDPRTGKTEAQATFTVVANRYASLDGNPPVPAGTTADPPIHQDSDSLDSTSDNSLPDGQYVQTPSASTSTEIAADRQEADVFYVDGVNWPRDSATPSHDCFVGYNGFLSGPPTKSPIPFSGTHS
jgi:hypothetical protein